MTSTQKGTEFSCDKNDKLQVFLRTFVGHEDLISFSPDISLNIKI